MQALRRSQKPQSDGDPKGDSGVAGMAISTTGQQEDDGMGIHRIIIPQAPPVRSKCLGLIDPISTGRLTSQHLSQKHLLNPRACRFIFSEEAAALILEDAGVRAARSALGLNPGDGDEVERKLAEAEAKLAGLKQECQRQAEQRARLQVQTASLQQCE